MRRGLAIIIFGLIMTISAQAEIYKQIRVFKTDRETLQMLAGFEIIDFKENQYVEIIADERGFDFIRSLAVPMEIIHEDLTAFFQSRYPLGTTMGGFRTYLEVVAALDSLADDYPLIVTSKISIGQTEQGRGLWMVKVSDNPNVDEAEPEIFINGLHHAREPITPEVCVGFIRELAEGYGNDPEITGLVNNNEFFILPIVNPDGYEYNRQTNPSGGGMWRKNRRNNGDGTYGVDLNRNYSYFWSYDNSGSSGDTWYDTYRGPSSGSEPEIQALMNFITDHDFAWVINYHAHGNLLIWPWGYNAVTNDEVDLYRELFGNYAEDTLGYEPGTPWETVNYNTNGSATDWGFGERRTKKKTYAMCIEIGNYSDYFWPPVERIPVLVAENIDALMNFSHKAYEIYKRRQPPVPEIISPLVAPANQEFYLHWQSADIDTFNAAASYRVVEKSGYQVSTQTCESAAPFEFNHFSLNSAREHSGSYSIYSGRGDRYEATAVLKERLLVKSGDTLTFWTWYNIESDWDYAYVEASTDGFSWWPITGNRSTAYNPNNHNEGNGITGSSGGWVLAKFYLNDFIGQEIDIRFRYWTDDSVDEEGIYIDDIYPYESFQYSTVLTESAHQESLLVGPYGPGTYYFQTAARDDREDLSRISDRFAIEITGQVYTLSGHVELSDFPDYLGESVVTISGLGFFDSTDISGNYAIANIPSARYDIRASHNGYLDSIVTDFTISADSEWNFLLERVPLEAPILISPEEWAELDTSYVEFDWSDVDYATGYVFELASDDMFSIIVGLDSARSESDYNLAGLNNGIYYWRVTAFDDTRFSPRSDEWMFEVNLPWESQAPQLIAPGDGFISLEPYIEFSWYELSGATAYLFELALDEQFGDVAVLDSNITSTIFDSDSLANDWYWWRLKATNGQSWTEYSAGRSFQIDYDSSYVDFLPGDANGDGRVLGSDVTYLVEYFRGVNPPPDPLLAGDTNGDCVVIGSDVTYLVNFFRGLGAAPIRGDCFALINHSRSSAEDFSDE